MVGLALAVISCGTSLTADATPAAKAAAPKPGSWKLHQLFDNTRGGQFTVTRHHPKVKALQTKIGPGESQYCGTGTVRALGNYRIHLVHGGGSSVYVVGKGLDASASFGVSPVKATVRFHGKKYPGDVRLRFEGAGSSEGQIDFSPVPNMSCDLSFDARHHH
jgi:hypothetical protein